MADTTLTSAIFITDIHYPYHHRPTQEPIGPCQMSKQIVIGIIGRKRVGKDTAADYIAKKYDAPKVALADPLKRVVCGMFGITMEELDEYKNEHWDLTAVSNRNNMTADEHRLTVSFRSILQRIGDEQKAFFGLDCYMRKFAEETADAPMVIVPDVRLIGEQRWLKENTHAMFIRIDRQVELDIDSEHRTEQELNSMGYDYLIDNDGSRGDLYFRIEKALEEINN